MILHEPENVAETRFVQYLRAEAAASCKVIPEQLRPSSQIIRIAAQTFLQSGRLIR